MKINHLTRICAWFIAVGTCCPALTQQPPGCWCGTRRSAPPTAISRSTTRRRWGKLYAIHLQPQGSSYTATKEEFLSGGPLPLTDAIIHPVDGAMYFTIGGRRVQSGFYRVTYHGMESTAPVKSVTAAGAKERQSRQNLEAFHGRQDPRAVKAAWPELTNEDRFVRWAARTALEHQPVATWADRALTEKDPGLQVEALLALTRVTGIDPQHRRQSDAPVDKAMQGKILDLTAYILSGGERQHAMFR